MTPDDGDLAIHRALTSHSLRRQIKSIERLMALHRHDMEQRMVNYNLLNDKRRSLIRLFEELNQQRIGVA
jgi:hypothetical protein